MVPTALNQWQGQSGRAAGAMAWLVGLLGWSWNYMWEKEKLVKMLVEGLGFWLSSLP